MLGVILVREVCESPLRKRVKKSAVLATVFQCFGNVINLNNNDRDTIGLE